jgi:predicted lipoprotein with Yx(FWY)xxD motif
VISAIRVAQRSHPAQAARGARGSAVLAAVLLCVGMLTACSSNGHGDSLLMIPIPSQVTLQTATVAGLGTILTDSEGHALYMFPPDAGSTVRCTGACAGTWPPLDIVTGDKPTAKGAVNPADLGTLADPNTGARIVTYGGFPLYRYAGDLTAGTANGQGLFSDGGPWYTLSPDLQPITTIPTTSAGSAGS